MDVKRIASHAGLNLAALALAFIPLAAQAAPEPAKSTEPAKEEKPITQQDASAGDVAATPISDLNLKKSEIPKLLLDAQEKPYDLTGLGTCPRLVAAVDELDRMLGNDIDITAVANSKLQAGRVAQSVIGSFIPFRGVIREVSGANASDRKLRAAIIAGDTRRGFLKGVGLSRGCAYPARPASLKDAARVLAADAAADPKNKDKQEAAARAADAVKAEEAAATASKRGKSRKRR